jgi:fibronectin type 3 domain-containing protein
MKKVTRSIFLIALLVMMSASCFTAYADPVEEVTLNYQLSGEKDFYLYISESDNETGTKLMYGKGFMEYFNGSTKLDPLKTYYLHISFNDEGTSSRFAGKFVLNGTGLEFGNNTNTLVSNATDFKFSHTGFGKGYIDIGASTTDYISVPVSLAPAKWTILPKPYSKPVYLTAIIKPVQSSSLSVKAISAANGVNLSWNSVSGATSYSVERSTTAGGPYTPIASDLTETSYTDKSVTANTTYYYVVKAKLSDTESVTSAEVSGTPTTETPTLDSKLKVVLEPTESLQLSVDDNLAINTNMTWTSSDNTVATVNEKGVVTALAPGNTVITVKSPDDTYTDYINVLVVEDASDYRLAIDLKVGQSARLTVDDLTNTVNATWEPMDSAIANVTSKGKVTALKKGLVLFTAKDEEGNVIGKVYVRVRE